MIRLTSGASGGCCYRGTSGVTGSLRHRYQPRFFRIHATDAQLLSQRLGPILPPLHLVDQQTQACQYLDTVQDLCPVKKWGILSLGRSLFPSAQHSLGRFQLRMWPFGSSGSDKPPATPKPSPAENKQVQGAKKTASEFDPAKLPEREKLPPKLQKMVDSSDKDDFLDELYEG